MAPVFTPIPNLSALLTFRRITSSKPNEAGTLCAVLAATPSALGSLAVCRRPNGEILRAKLATAARGERGGMVVNLSDLLSGREFWGPTRIRACASSRSS